MVGGAAIAAVVGSSAFACSSSAKGAKANGHANNANDLQGQEEALTVSAFDAVNQIPAQQYPADRMVDSLEMRNLRKKLLTFNDANKQGWVYLISMGTVLAKIECMGKVSSTQSAMTTDLLVWQDRGTGGGGNVPIKGPGDDLSFGPNEGGDRGIFFYTPDGGYVSWAGDYLYTDFEMAVGPDGRLTVGSTKPTRSAT